MVAHAIVAVGAAGGGLEPLRRITERLSRNCGATVFVVMHSGAASFLPEMLGWHGAQGNGGRTALLLRSARRECRHAQSQKS